LLVLSPLAQICRTAAVAPLMQHQVEEIAESARLLDRQQSSSTFTVVTGITTISPQTRLEIRQMEKNVDQWNIYLLGLRHFMQADEKDKLSYYQIAGIHGRPFVPWDGVPAAPGIEGPGYCIHNSQLLLPWHRPYLALFEQVLYTHIIAVVNTFSGAQKTRYTQAALSWRQPYWDWAAAPPVNQSVFPSSLTRQNVTVTMPNGTATISNPLYAFQFHPVTQQDFTYDPWSEWQTTLRAPPGPTSDAVSHDELLGPILDNSRISFRDRLYNLFTSYSNFSEFGTEAYTFGSTPIRNADSLESIHDVLHGITGSGGHMTYLDYAAYDPIFWLHHTMIDRCFALWQAVNPNSYVVPTKMYTNSFTIPQNQVVDINTREYCNDCSIVCGTDSL
jgi:tyrosinase